MYVEAKLAVQPKICCRCMCLISDRQHTLPETKAAQATCLIFSRVLKSNGKRKRLAEKLAVIRRGQPMLHGCPAPRLGCHTKLQAQSRAFPSPTWSGQTASQSTPQKNNTERHAMYCSSGRSPWPAGMSLHCTALLPDVRPGFDFPTAACDDARLPARQASSSRACHAAVHSWVSLQPDVANSLPCCSTPLLVQSQTAACTSLGPMHRCVPPHSLSSTAVRALFIVVHASGQL